MTVRHRAAAITAGLAVVIGVLIAAAWWAARRGTGETSATSAAAAPPAASAPGASVAFDGLPDHEADRPVVPIEVAEVKPAAPATPPSAASAAVKPPTETVSSFRVVVVDAGAHAVQGARVETWTPVRLPPDDGKAAAAASGGAATGSGPPADRMRGVAGALDAAAAARNAGRWGAPRDLAGMMLADRQVTDALGRAVVQLPSDEMARLQAEKEGVGESRSIGHGEALARRNGDGDVVLPLEAVGTLEGLVLDAGGAPAAGVAVNLNSRPNGTILGSTTDAEGRFRREGLHELNWTVGAEDSERRRVSAKVEIPPLGTASVTLRLPGEWFIDGVVLGADGAVKPGATVLAFHGPDLRDPWNDVTREHRSWAPTRTADDGTFRLPVAVLEPHVVIAYAPDEPASAPALLRLDELNGRANVTLRMSVPALISGRVVGPDGAPVAGAVMTAAPASPPILLCVKPTARMVRLVADGPPVPAGNVTDTDGTFVLDGLVPGGAYDLKVMRSGRRGSAPGVTTLPAVPAGSRDVLITVPDPVEPEPATAVLRFLVRSQATGEVVSHFTWRLEGADSRAPAAWGMQDHEDAGGALQVDRLVPGKAYTIVVKAYGFGGASLADLRASGDPAPVPVLLPAPGRLEVAVEDEHGLPLPHLAVTLRRPDGLLGFLPLQLPSAFTDAAGHAVFLDLDPGSYSVSVQRASVVTESVVDVAGGQAAFLRVTAKDAP